MDTNTSNPRGAGGQDRRGDSKTFSRGGGRGGRGNSRGKKRDLGRSAWSKQKGDKRKQNEEYQAAKRQKVDNGDGEKALPVYATKFSEEDLKAEERRPKKKVAVLIGYSGTGYKGMQLAHDQKTIEGDLFQAFVAAGAISKANADDPKKSSFVRCARTDKGVHAAGNVISLKLIVEDENIIQKINDNLNPQIRVWGFERTNNSFSAYQLVDSRIYEYLIPSHSFLPPHPKSYLGRQCAEWAAKKGELETWKERQEEVAGYWEKVDEEIINPILGEYDEDVRDILEKALWLKAEEDASSDSQDNDQVNESSTTDQKETPATTMVLSGNDTTSSPKEDTNTTEAIAARRERAQMINEAVKRLRNAYISARRTYRIPEKRRQRLREILNAYVGTRNYHNYTVQKSFTDPSAKRVIKSFVVEDKPILIDGTEWLSLKVHGQSFMMHQIRKMVGMAALIVRCGADPRFIQESYGPQNISIPKAPSLGLLLERPIFESYNKRATEVMGHNPVDFTPFREQIDAFKQTQIYERMYRDEEKENIFGNFFNHIDNFPSETFLFVTSGGIAATKPEGNSSISNTNTNTVATTSVARNANVGSDHQSGKANEVDKEVDIEGDGSDSDIDDIKDDAGNEG